MIGRRKLLAILAGPVLEASCGARPMKKTVPGISLSLWQAGASLSWSIRNDAERELAVLHPALGALTARAYVRVEDGVIVIAKTQARAPEGFYVRSVPAPAAVLIPPGQTLQESLKLRDLYEVDPMKEAERGWRTDRPVQRRRVQVDRARLLVEVAWMTPGRKLLDIGIVVPAFATADLLEAVEEIPLSEPVDVQAFA